MKINKITLLKYFCIKKYINKTSNENFKLSRFKTLLVVENLKKKVDRISYRWRHSESFNQWF